MNKTSFAAIAIALASLMAGQAMAADAAGDTKSGEQVATVTKAAAKPTAETKGKDSADAFAEYDKIKKW